MPARYLASAGKCILLHSHMLFRCTPLVYLMASLIVIPLRMQFTHPVPSILDSVPPAVVSSLISTVPGPAQLGGSERSLLAGWAMRQKH